MHLSVSELAQGKYMTPTLIQMEIRKKKPPSFTFSKPRSNFESSTLLFCRRQLRNVQRYITHVHSCCSINQSFRLEVIPLPLPSWFTQGPYSCQRECFPKELNGLYCQAPEELKKTTTEIATGLISRPIAVHVR